MRGLPFPLSRGIYFVSVVGLEPTMFSSRVLVPKTNAFQPNFATLTFRVSGGIWTPIYQVAAGYLSHSDTLTFIRAFDRIWTYNPFITSEVHYQLCYKGILVVDVGYDPTTSTISAWCSTNWANQLFCSPTGIRTQTKYLEGIYAIQLHHRTILADLVGYDPTYFTLTECCLPLSFKSNLLSRLDSNQRPSD